MGFSLKHLFHTAGQLNPVTVGHNLVTGNLLGGGGGNGQAAKVDYLSEQARQQNAQNFARADVERRRALGDIQQGYKGAQGALAQGRTQALQGVADQGAMASANATQQLARSGMANTTIATNAQQGVSAGMTRAQAGIEAQYAQLLSQLNIGQANATAQVRQGIAGGAQSFGQSQAGLYANQAGLVNSQPQQDPNAWLESLFQLGGTALGYGLGGGFGGGGTQYPKQYGPQP